MRAEPENGESQLQADEASEGPGEGLESALLPSPLKTPRVKLVRAVLVEEMPPIYEALCEPAAAARFFTKLIGNADREHFIALYLDSQHRPTHAHVVSVGTVNEAMVHPREVFKAALLANAQAIIVGHNHPSGDVLPSELDKGVSKRLREAVEVLGIEVLDSIIVGPSGTFYSATDERVREV